MGGHYHSKVKRDWGGGGGWNSYWNPVTAGTEKDRLPYRGCVSGGTPLLCRDEVLDEGRQGK